MWWTCQIIVFVVLVTNSECSSEKDSMQDKHN